MRKVILLLVVALFAKAEAEWVFEPVKCKEIPAHLIATCIEGVKANGEFEYRPLGDVSDCKRIKDASQVASCILEYANGRKYYVSGHEKEIIGIKSDINNPKSPEERIAKASETIAFYAKIQAIITLSLLSIGVVCGVIILVASD